MTIEQSRLACPPPLRENKEKKIKARHKNLFEMFTRRKASPVSPPAIIIGKFFYPVNDNTKDLAIFIT